MAKISRILHPYGMYPYQGEKITKKVIKVFTGSRYIAVKQSREKHLTQRFGFVYHEAKEKNLTSIAPLYLTEKGRPYIEGRHHFYYVVPWFKEKEGSSLTSSLHPFLGELAHIHRKTSVTKPIEIQQLNEWSQNQKEKIKKNFYQFENWIDLFEAQHFMSPTALLICHSYRMVRQMSHLLEYWYDEWRAHMEEEKEMKYCLCHGNLSPSHFVLTSNGVMFINWEQAFYGHPSRDLSMFFSTICQEHDTPLSLIKEGLPVYFKDAGYTKSDMALLAIHLLNVKDFLLDVQQYVKAPNHLTEVEWIQVFQRYQFYFEHVLDIQEFIKNDLMLTDD
ncbi:hypothetical protein GCM10008986_05840 [Salinibacillus aidingensis]|uniref:Aminoglycoside phosphotransferase domain-containing protein n=1 Tax=Salinibacillus aidingensis TaxID=237684 RepID=A0ABP3KRP8_9BACI